MKKMKKALAIATATLFVAAGLHATVSVPSTNVPLPIPDNNAAGVNSTLIVDNTTVPNPGSIVPPWNATDVNVQFSITHTWDGDIHVSIASPVVAAVEIMSNCGGSGNDFTNTVIDDAGAAGGCAIANAPFTGTFQARQGAGGAVNPTALAAFNGTDTFGTWTLNVRDDAGLDIGTLTAWSVTLSGLAPLPVELLKFDVK